MTEHIPAVRHGAATDVGLVRATNEDSMLARPPVFAVADGMGGHSGGDVASRIAVEELGRLVDDGTTPTRDAVGAALARAQARLADYTRAQRDTQPRWYSGTTVVVASVLDEGAGPSWLVANLGDSRAYVLSGGRLRQVTTDHSVVQELVDSGQITPEEAATHPERSVITRALGGSTRVEPDYFTLPVAEVDRLLLCSDGITGMLDDDDVAEVLREVGDPQEAADLLVRRAVEAGGIDNATAVVAELEAVSG